MDGRDAWSQTFGRAWATFDAEPVPRTRVGSKSAKVGVCVAEVFLVEEVFAAGLLPSDGGGGGVFSEPSGEGDRGRLREPWAGVA